MTENALVAQPFELVVNARRFEIEAKNRQEIQKFISSQLTEGTDFGSIPGCDGSVLFQPGAQKICSLLGVYADYDTTHTEMQDGHREYRSKVVLRTMGSDVTVSQGIGACSTMEKKYRYRNEAGFEDTGMDLPRGWFDLKNKDKAKAQEAIGGKGFRAEKIKGKWKIVKILKGAQVENPDIADVYNTCMKMAMKRALVQATLNVCGGWSDRFEDRDEPLDKAPQSEPDFDQDGPEPLTRMQTLNKLFDKAQQRGFSAQEARGLWGQTTSELNLGDINKATEEAFQEAVFDYTARIERLKPQQN